MSHSANLRSDSFDQPACGNVYWADGAWHPPLGSGWRETLHAAALGLLIAALFVVPGGWMTYRAWAAYDAARTALMPKPWLLEELRTLPALAAVPVESATHGRDLFVSACAACHGPSGGGIPGLGKNIVDSWFVASLDDGALHRFVKIGRRPTDPANTTKILMPPKGGRDDYTDDDLRDIVVYVRGLQDPRRLPELPAMQIAKPAPPTADDTAKWLEAAKGDTELAEYIASGAKLYSTTCIACHGADARGIKNNGKDLIASEFSKKLDDDALLAFIKRGRDPSDPLNTTGIGMPAKGGNPALDDDDLLDIIAYVRARQTASAMK